MAERPIQNPNPKNLIALRVKFKDELTLDDIEFLFPLNPEEFSVNQTNRVGVTFTYGDKVFQNLGRGLKTITISGHTGFKLDYQTYGILKPATASILAQESANEKNTGKLQWLDLRSLVQLIKGENIYMPTVDAITEKYSIENIDNINTAQIIVPDENIAYDVILQSDSFMRSKDQPHKYKYTMTFAVTNEVFFTSGTGYIPPEATEDDPEKQISIFESLKSKIQEVKDDVINSEAYQSVKNTIDGISRVTAAAKDFVVFTNSTLNEIKRLEMINDVFKTVTDTTNQLTAAYLNLKSFANGSAFYETKIYAKQASNAAVLFKRTIGNQQKDLSFRFVLSRLAAVDTPLTLASNKEVIATIKKDIRTIKSSGFAIPISSVTEQTSNISAGKNIVINLSASLSSVGIKTIKVFSTTDFNRENDLVDEITDNQIVLRGSFFELGTIFNFEIQYDYTTFENLPQNQYKSIRRIRIAQSDTWDNILKKYAREELNTIPSYQSAVAYLNNIEFPYIVPRNSSSYVAMAGTFAYNLFDSLSDFTKFVQNIAISSSTGPDLTLYRYSDLDPLKFKINEPSLISFLSVSDRKFFIVLLKENYSNRLYALFGVLDSYASSTAKILTADKYMLVALERGKSYDVILNTTFEILSPYNITTDLVAFYGLTTFASSLSPDNFFDRDVQIINKIYEYFVTSELSSAFAFTTADKTFLAGDVSNNNFFILTNETIAAEQFVLSAFSMYRILSDNDFILLPSLSDKYLSIGLAFNRDDVYKIDLDAGFIDNEIIKDPYTQDTVNYSGVVDFRLINGLSNVKQALKNRLECPTGGYSLHPDYGTPNLLGKKNSAENLILMKYSIYNQLTRDPRVKIVKNVNAKTINDKAEVNADVILVNNDEVKL